MSLIGTAFIAFLSVGNGLSQGLSPGSGNESQEDTRPNILWLVSEDNSPFLGCYGDPFAATPNLDKLASEGILYEHAFSVAPVCAPSRFTLITGTYPSSMGTLHMRSNYPIPGSLRFFPHYLRQAGYYTTNNSKKDYNTVDQPEAWDESGKEATYLNRKPGQPFFAVFNVTTSHESALHQTMDTLQHDPEKVPIPPYHPPTPEMKHDWAQYYDKITEMDQWIGERLRELEAAGLAENTIVFYYSDHGGVLGRSKRFLYESGLHTPLLIRFPEKYAYIAPGPPGTRSDRIVSFIDFPPTLLSMAGIPVPPGMQGEPFLGTQATAPREYAFSLRGRMDSRMDMGRTVRDKRYRYIRNFMPHKPNGQYLEYLWRAPSMRSWEAAWRAGTLNETQSRFWKPKPPEELYDVTADPHNIHNLAGDPAFRKVLERMRKQLRNWQLSTRDAGLIPESMMEALPPETTIRQFALGPDYPMEKILETAEMASSRDPEFLDELISALSDSNPVVRYWAATGCIVLVEKALPAKQHLLMRLTDPVVSVRIASAEALYHLNGKQAALKTLSEALGHPGRMARMEALNALSAMGRDATPVLPAVKSLLAPDPTGNDYDLRAARALLENMEKPE
ncbi:MAG: sulfatase-like hydrolase/transferase [Solitalea sp.]